MTPERYNTRTNSNTRVLYPPIDAIIISSQGSELNINKNKKAISDVSMILYIYNTINIIFNI